MRLTSTHALFWNYHKGPQWVRAQRDLGGRVVTAPSVHWCINEHAARYWPDTRARSEPGNTVNLVKMRRRQDTSPRNLRDYLNYLASGPSRHAVTARRWLRRLRKYESEENPFGL